jgi:CheY-like chemotaxis protein
VADPIKRILIVEDAEPIAASMAELLHGEGYEVACAANGQEALQHLESAQPLPDLILLDLMMPLMDGYEFRAQQRRDPRLSNIPVLLMTAGGDIQAKARELEARGYLKKPFKDVITILDTIERCL